MGAGEALCHIGRESVMVMSLGRGKGAAGRAYAGSGTQQHATHSHERAVGVGAGAGLGQAAEGWGTLCLARPAPAPAAAWRRGRGVNSQPKPHVPPPKGVRARKASPRPVGLSPGGGGWLCGFCAADFAQQRKEFLKPRCPAARTRRTGPDRAKEIGRLSSKTQRSGAACARAAPERAERAAENSKFFSCSAHASRVDRAPREHSRPAHRRIFLSISERR